MDSIDKLTMAMSRLSTANKRRPKRHKKKKNNNNNNKKKTKRTAKNKKKSTTTRRRGWGAGAIFGMLARGAVRWAPRILRATAKGAIKYVPRAIVRDVAMNAGMKALKAELKKRRAQSWTLLGSIRYAALEKQMEEEERWQKQHAKYLADKKRYMGFRLAKKAGRRSGWKSKIARAKRRAIRQTHVERAMKRSKRLQGISH